LLARLVFPEGSTIVRPFVNGSAVEPARGAIFGGFEEFSDLFHFSYPPVASRQSIPRRDAK
jgi:hypothetical protein